MLVDKFQASMIRHWCMHSDTAAKRYETFVGCFISSFYCYSDTFGGCSELQLPLWCPHEVSSRKQSWSRDADVSALHGDSGRFHLQLSLLLCGCRLHVNSSLLQCLYLGTRTIPLLLYSCQCRLGLHQSASKPRQVIILQRWHGCSCQMMLTVGLLMR